MSSATTCIGKANQGQVIEPNSCQEQFSSKSVFRLQIIEVSFK